MRQRVRTTHLELLASDALRAGTDMPADVLLARASIPSPELNRFLYTAVGGDWHWADRLPWTWARWMEWVGRAEVETWVAHQRGTPVGFSTWRPSRRGACKSPILASSPASLEKAPAGFC